MKNQQKGFLIAAMIAIVLILSIGGGTYVYLESKKVELALKENAKVSTSTNIVDNTSVNTQGNTTSEALSNSANEEEVMISNSTTTVDNTATTTEENTTLSTSSKIETMNNLENNIKSNTTDLWSIIDKETLALKNKDIESIKKLYYTQPTVEESSQLKQQIPYLLEQNTKMNKSDYVDIWQDEKQAIYSTGLLKENNQESYGYKKGIIMFVNDKGGWKILSKNEQIWSVPSIITAGGAKITQAEADKSLKEMVIDKDKDGLTDNEETCSGNFKNTKDCKKTDPNKRDTSGDGWWDGINKAMTDIVSR